MFPIHQAALVPKINAPVRKFYVNRGSHVRSGQLLAVLENRDLVAGAQQSQGEYEQAQASFVTTTVAGVPEEVQKAELDDHAAKQNLEAEQKVYESRQNLFKQGALFYGALRKRYGFDQEELLKRSFVYTIIVTTPHG